ncbi:MAG TPA: type IV pilin protein [Steroidobacteraceae bacterium]|nr:type IV pilin protein [Steroidobacteraceae bacterium]
MAQTRSADGFTLIEVVVALAVVTITTSLAFSTYRRHVQRGHRVEAVQALLAAAAEQEKFHLAHGQYADRLDAAVGSEPPGIPIASTTPRGRYRLRIVSADAAGYRLIAERAGASDDPSCVRLSIDESGRRQASDAADRDTTTTCW